MVEKLLVDCKIMSSATLDSSAGQYDVAQKIDLIESNKVLPKIMNLGARMLLLDYYISLRIILYCKCQYNTQTKEFRMNLSLLIFEMQM